jgi:DNA modification methylase
VDTRILKQGLIDWTQCRWLQPRDLKAQSPEQRQKLKRSLLKNGFASPFHVWNDGKTDWLLDGCHREDVLRELKAEGHPVPDELPAVWVNAKSKKEAVRLSVVFMSQYADIQPGNLLNYLEDMKIPLADFRLEIDIPTFDLGEIGAGSPPAHSSAAGENVDVVEESVPEPPKKPVTKPGDVWLLGEHRLLCGDSTKPESFETLMGGERATCVFTDPPYGVSVGAKNRMLNSVQPSGRNLTDIESDDLAPEDLELILRAAFINAREIGMANDCAVYLTAPQGGELGMMMTMMMRDAGLPVRHVLIWVKSSPTFSMGRLDYDYQHEPILFTWVKTHKRIRAGAFQTSVWPVNKPQASPEHPTMKPVALYENAFLNSSEAGDIVLDPFAGSGTCIIAAEQTGRKARAIEISPAYCDVIIKRWQQFTGKRAKHAQTGKEFPQ